MNATMADLQQVIERRRRELEGSAFVQGIERSSIDGLRGFVPQLYFYVYAFQDVLRLSAATITDPRLKAIATTHRDEDAGHQRWFGTDALALGCVRDIEWMFGPAHEQTRDFAYTLVAEVLRADDDRLRLVVPLVLEAAGSVFFFRVIDVLERVGYDRPLHYFARHHQDVEAAHGIFSETTGDELGAIELEPAAYDRAEGIVNRSFDHVMAFAAWLEHHRARGEEARRA